VSVKDFSESLIRLGHRIVLTLINVTEVLAPVLSDNNTDRMCTTFRLLDSIPHCNLRESFLIVEEIDLALKAFRAGQCVPTVLNPYVLDWRDTVTPPWSVDPNAQHVCMSPEAFLKGMYKQNPQFFRPHAPHTDTLRALLADNRLTNPKERRAAARELLRGSLERHMRQQAFIAPTGEDLETFSDWVYDHPMYCPSFWISFLLYQRWVDNRTDAMNEGDTHDFNLALCLPYVDALTLDRRMLAYVQQAIRGTPLAHLESRLYPDLRTWFEKTGIQ
jgi:hypothetical protein